VTSTDGMRHTMPHNTEPVKPQTGLTTHPLRGETLDILTPNQRAAVYERKARNQLALEIRANTWGKDLTAGQVRAIAEWSWRHAVDPVTEVEILGGRLYLNANYYGRRMSELIAAGRLEYVQSHWIHVDDRLLEAAKGGNEWAKAQLAERWMARIEHRVPEDADAALVFEIKCKELTAPLYGVKFHVPGLRQKNNPGRAKDPVGDEFPTETIETRAMRRAMLMLQRIDPEVALAPSDVPILEQPEPEPARLPLTKSAYTQPAIAAVRDEALIARAAPQAEPVAVEREPGEEDADDSYMVPPEPSTAEDADDDDGWIAEQDAARGRRP